MEIKCPKCGEALELPDEAVGRSVSCPFCNAKFIGDDMLRLCPATGSSVSDNLEQCIKSLPSDLQDIVSRLCAGVKDSFRQEGVEVCAYEAFEGHGNVIVMFNVIRGCSYAKAEKHMRKICCSWGAESWGCLPGKSGIAVEYSRDSVARDCESIAEFVKRDVWCKQVANVDSVPFPLGADIANRDIVLNLAAFSALCFVRSDMPPYDEFIGPRLEALHNARPDIEFHFIGCGRRDVLPGPAGEEIGRDEEMPWLDIPSDEDEVSEWCDNIVKTLSNIENEIEVRKRLLETVDVSDVFEYNRKFDRRLKPIVVLVINLPEPENWEDNCNLRHKAWEPLEKLMNMIDDDLQRFGVHFLISYTLEDHPAMSDWIGERLDPYYNSDRKAGIVMHWGNYHNYGGNASARKGFLGPEAVRVRCGHFFVYRSPDNEVYGIHNFAESHG